MSFQPGQIRKSEEENRKIHSFRNKSLLEAALRHSSCQDSLSETLPSFERLEFLGDSILNFIVSRKVYSLYGSAAEGSLSRYRAALVSRRTLALIAGSIGLDKQLRTGKSIPSQKALEEKILADALEALIAAIYLDGGMKAAESFIHSAFKRFWKEVELTRLTEDPKSELQELCQKRWKSLPDYSWVAVKGGIRCEVRIDRFHVCAEARSKKKAAAEAAALMLEQIRL